MHIDTSSTVGRIDHLRAGRMARPQPFDPATTDTKSTKSRTGVLDDVAAKRRAQAAPPANNLSTTLVRHNRPQVTDKQTTGPSQQPAVGSTQNQPDNPINSLLADWGKSDSNYDLNSDGTVDTKDLLMLLEKLAAQDVPVDSLPDNPVSQSIQGAPNIATSAPKDDPEILITYPGQPASSIDELLADWGKTDSNYDLNSDGIVNTEDLLMLLNKIAAQENPTGNVDGNPTIQGAPNIATSAPKDNPEILVSYPGQPANSVDELMADWGKTDSNYDLNSDGIVNTEDLLMLLSKLAQSDDMTRVQGPTERPSHTALADMKVSADGSINEVNPKIQQISRGIAERLISLHDQDQDGQIGIKEAGDASVIFGHIDANGDTQIDKLELANSIQDMLMGRLNQDSSANLNKFISETMQLFTNKSEQGAKTSRSEAHTSINRAYQRVNTDQAANQLSQRLANNGESELRRFLNSTDMSTTDKRSILSQLHNLNMGNMGVNVVG